MLSQLPLLSLLGWLPFTFASPHQKVHNPTDTNAESVPLITGASTRSHPTSQPHTSFSGTPSITGALTATSIGKGISTGDIIPEATTYPSDGKLQDSQPAAYVPEGGIGTNGSVPVYNVKSDFDYESLVCAHFEGRFNHRANTDQKNRRSHCTKSGSSSIFSRTDCSASLKGISCPLA